MSPHITLECHLRLTAQNADSGQSTFQSINGKVELGEMRQACLKIEICLDISVLSRHNEAAIEVMSAIPNTTPSSG